VLLLFAIAVALWLAELSQFEGTGFNARQRSTCLGLTNLNAMFGNRYSGTSGTSRTSVNLKECTACFQKQL